MSRDDEMAAGVPMPDYAVLNEPARPVEDREPAGPYAPTRDGAPQPKLSLSKIRSGLAEAWLAERFDTLADALHDLTVAVVGDDGPVKVVPIPESEQMITMDPVTFGKIRDANYERGRQQGDADRAQRGVREFERGRLSGLIEGKNEGEDKLIEARSIARAAVEAELLDQGWTPPGAITEQIAATTWDPYPDHWTADERTAERQHREKLLSLVAETEARTLADQVNYPTGYEVWRDALTLSATNVFPIDGTGEAGTFDDDRRAQILADAEFFRDKLINYPTISPSEANQTLEDYITDKYEDDRSGPAE